MSRMAQKKLDHRRRMAYILYRSNRGDSIAHIASVYQLSATYIYGELARARANADIKAMAAQLGDRQMSFDFNT